MLAPYLPPIGLIGKKRHGKDSVGAHLVSRYGCRRRAFADAVRLSLYTLDPTVTLEADNFGPLREAGFPDPIGPVESLTYLVDNAPNGWEDLKGIREIRRLMQAHGMAVREIFGPDAWIAATFREPLRNGDVVTDVRLPNEAEAIRRAGGVLLRVTRPGMDDTDTHVTETALDTYTVDAEISNAGTLEDLGPATDAALGAAHPSLRYGY